MSEFITDMIKSAREKRQELLDLIAPAQAELAQVEAVLAALGAPEDQPEVIAPVEAPTPPSEETQRQQVIDELEPRTCALPGCNNDISHMSARAKYCSTAHKSKAAHLKRGKRVRVKVSKPKVAAPEAVTEPKEPKGPPKLHPMVLERTWLALREFSEGTNTNTLTDVGIAREVGIGNVGRTAVMYALKALEQEGRVTSEEVKIPQQTKRGTRLLPTRIYRIVSPQIRPGLPPDPTSRPRVTPPEVEVVRTNPTLQRTGGAPTGSYPVPKERKLQVAVRRAVAAGWKPRLNGKGDHRLRLDGPNGEVLYAPMNYTGHHLIRKVISDFRKAGVDC